jgi:tRNA threonylcarbamoyladenosine biosynthesis protein TsaE
MAEIYTCQSLEGLKPIAESLMEFHKDKRIFAFHGEMGAGKTTFIKSICGYLKVTDTVSSPTYAIVNEYFTEDSNSVFHFDLYRLKSWTEMLEIGYEDYFYGGNYCLLEWPEKIVNLLPEETVHVSIVVSADSEERTITF